MESLIPNLTTQNATKPAIIQNKQIVWFQAWNHTIYIAYMDEIFARSHRIKTIVCIHIPQNARN